MAEEKVDIPMEAVNDSIDGGALENTIFDRYGNERKPWTCFDRRVSRSANK